MNPINTLVHNETQLFTDNELIECCQSVTRRLHKPERKEQPVIVADRPWEECLYFTYSNYTVRYDPTDGRIKCWYEDLGVPDGKRHPFHNSLLYAESEDGLHFHKPELDVCEVDGRRTNIVMGYAKGGKASSVNPWAEGGVHSNAVIIDPHPRDNRERYRTVFSECRFDADRPYHRSDVAHSPDGVHWHGYCERPSYGSARDSLSDVSCLFYDEESREFVQNTRHGGQGPAAVLPADTPQTKARWFGTYYPHRPDLMNKRRIWQTRSHDFVHWSEPLLICSPDDEIDNLDEAYYGMPMFRVGRHYFGTMGVFRFVENGMVVRLMQSRDGIHWRAMDNAAPFFEPRGPEFWDSYMVSITSEPVERNGEWWFYHGGSNSRHDWWMSGDEHLPVWEAEHPERVRFGLGVATLRKEGFASLYAGLHRPGYVRTRFVETSGSRLFVNARTGTDGYVRVELTGRDGAVIGGCGLEECDSFTGDSVAHQVTWNGSLDIPGSGEMRKLRIRFVLRNANLYSFRFAEAP